MRYLCALSLIVACSSGKKEAARPTEPTPAAASAAPEASPPGPAPAATEDDRVLILDGTPEIPAELSARLAQYQETRSAHLEDISDDGGTILVTTRFGEVSQLHQVDAPLNMRRQLSFSQEPVRSALFAPGDAVIYSADVGGDEQHQLYRLSTQDGQRVQLTTSGSRNGSAVWSPDRTRLAYASNARNKVDFDIVVADGVDPSSARTLVETKGWWYPLSFSRSGKKLLVGEYVSVTESRIYSVDMASGQLTRLSPESPVAAYSDAVLANDEKSVFLTSDREGEFRELYKLDLASGAFTPLSRSIPWNVEEIALSPDGRTLVFSCNEGGISVLRSLSTRGGKPKPIKGVPAGVISGLRFANKVPTLAFTLSGAARPTDVYTYDLRRRKLARWTESETGGLAASSFVEPTLIEYPTFDGAKIPAFYYRPVGEGPFPVVVSIHGGPEVQYRPRLSPVVQYLVRESKIAVLAPNVRGSNGYGKTYLTLDNGKKREDSVKDIGALLDWVAGQKELDPDRVAVMGGSYGGYMVLASLGRFGARIRAGIDVVGISSFVTFLENTADYRRELRRVEYGDESDPEMRKFLESISPLSYADKIDSALFVAQGANDPRVPAGEAAQIVEAVRKAGHPVWYMLAKNEGHGFRRKENRDIYTALAVLFLESQLTAK